MNDLLEKRLTELEIKHSLSEELLDSLSVTVARQQQELDLLQAQLRLVYQQQNSKDEDGSSRSLLDEIPPHY